MTVFFLSIQIFSAWSQSPEPVHGGQKAPDLSISGNFLRPIFQSARANAKKSLINRNPPRRASTFKTVSGVVSTGDPSHPWKDGSPAPVCWLFPRRYRILASRMPGVATQDPSKAQPAADDQAVFLEASPGVIRAGRLKPAAGIRSEKSRQGRRQDQLIDPDEQIRHPGRDLGPMERSLPGRIHGLICRTVRFRTPERRSCGLR